MLHGEHSAILSTFIQLPFAFKVSKSAKDKESIQSSTKTFVLSIFEWLLKTGFAVLLLRPCVDAKGRDWGLDPAPPPSLENHKAVGCLCSTGMDYLDNHKGTQSVFTS